MTQDDWDDVNKGIDAYAKWKRAKAEARKAQLEVDAWWQLAQTEIDLARKRAEQEMEVARLERLSRLSLEALVLAARTPEQARVLESLARVNTMKGLSPQTIVALAAEKDPRLAEALSPVLLRMFEAGKADEYRQLLERLIATQKEGDDQSRQDYLASLRAFTQMFERFAETTGEVVRATAAPPQGGGARKRAGPSKLGLTPEEVDELLKDPPRWPRPDWAAVFAHIGPPAPRPSYNLSGRVDQILYGAPPEAEDEP